MTIGHRTQLESIEDSLTWMQSDMSATPIGKNSTFTLGHRSISLTISACAAALTAFFFVRWLPSMPYAVSDQFDISAFYAINEAVARHVVFGRDFIYTFGPLGMVYSGFYHPATDPLMLTASTLVAIGLCAGFVTLVWPQRIYLLLLLPIVVAESVTPDAVLLALPLLLLLVVFRLSAPRENRLHVPLRRSSCLCVAVLVCAVGILPSIKGTFLSLAAVEGGLAVLMAFVARRRAFAFGIMLFAIASLCISWVAAGQPLAALPRFFWAQEQIIIGYSQAQSMHGSFDQLLYWGIPAAVITVILYSYIVRHNGFSGFIVFLGFLFFSFVAFKEGFVRQDSNHVIISGETFLFMALFLSALLESLPAIAVAVVAFVGWAAVEGSMFSTVLARIETKARGAAQGIITRVEFPDALPVAFARTSAANRAAYPLPSVKGTVDLYPVNLAALFAAGMKWDGRPVIQSFAAYTPTLEAVNAQHLISNDAPANVFFAIDPIDGHLPALDDALSWPLLLSRYSIVGIHGNYLQMVHSAHPGPVRYDGRVVRIDVRLNKWIDVPSDGGFLWARIDMRPTVLGNLVLAAFKLPHVSIELRFKDGRTGRYRYIPELGRAGFLLSPAVGSTVGFGLVASGQDKSAEVQQLRLVAPEVGLWPRRVRLSIRKMDISPQPRVRGLFLTEPSSPARILTSGKISLSEDCSLDAIDGRPHRSLMEPIVSNSDRVNITGWTAPVAQRGIGPDETWFELKSANGEQRYYRAGTMSRPDVLAYFKQPKMKEPGFSAELDLLGLSGTQQLTIYSTHDNEAYRCPARALLQLSP